MQHLQKHRGLADGSPNDSSNRSALIVVSSDRTHAPPADSHCSDFVALSSALGRRRRMACRPCVSPSDSPRADAGSHPRSRLFLCRYRFHARGFRGSRPGWCLSPRLESPPEESQRQLGASVSRRRRQPRRRHRPVGISPARRLQRRHDGRPRARRQRRPHRHLRLARTQRYPRHHRRAALFGTCRGGACPARFLLYLIYFLYFLNFLIPHLRARRIHGRGHRATIRGRRSAHRSGRRGSSLRQSSRRNLRLRRSAKISLAGQNSFRPFHLDAALPRRKTGGLSRRGSLAAKSRRRPRVSCSSDLRRKGCRLALPSFRNDLRRCARPKATLGRPRSVPHRCLRVLPRRIPPPRPLLLRGKLFPCALVQNKRAVAALQNQESIFRFKFLPEESCRHRFSRVSLIQFPISLLLFPLVSAQCTGCCRVSHSWLSRRTVSRKRTASAAMVSSRCSPPCGSLPSFFR